MGARRCADTDADAIREGAERAGTTGACGEVERGCA